MSEHVTIEYYRPPDRTEFYVQELIFADETAIVTFLEHTPLKSPLVIGGEVALENGSPAVWFTFPERMHDIGRFHTANGVFTGVYANVLLPVELRDRTSWRATDLFLDIWIGRDARARILDENELARARMRGWIDAATALAATAEAARIVELHRTGRWPPAIVNEWPLERVLNARKADPLKENQ